MVPSGHPAHLGAQREVAGEEPLETAAAAGGRVNSMSGEPFAMAAVQELGDLDYVGVLAFDGAPSATDPGSALKGEEYDPANVAIK